MRGFDPNGIELQQWSPKGSLLFQPKKNAMAESQYETFFILVVLLAGEQE